MQGVHTDTEKTKFFVCTILLKSVVCFTLLGNISKIPVKLQKNITMKSAEMQSA